MKNKKKYFKIVSSTIIAGAFFLIAYGSGSDKNSEIKCETSDEGYKSGYNAGKTSVWDTPEAHIRGCNNGVGMLGKVPPCWNEGFRDARK